MTTLNHPYQYVVIRCVPRVDRGEFVNVAVVLHSQSADVLAIEAHVDEARLRSLHTNVDVMLFLPVVGGSLTSSFAIPNDPGLFGVQIHEQGLSFDPAANAAGMVVSNAITAVLGG